MLSLLLALVLSLLPHLLATVGVCVAVVGCFLLLLLLFAIAIVDVVFVVACCC